MRIPKNPWKSSIGKNPRERDPEPIFKKERKINHRAYELKKFLDWLHITGKHNRRGIQIRELNEDEITEQD